MSAFALVVDHPDVAEPDVAWLQERIDKLGRAIGAATDQTACIVLTTDEAVAELNREWRGIDGPTDVLSFAMQDAEGAELAAPGVLGDVFIAVETAARQATGADHAARLGRAAWGLREELLFLAIHGALHLLGWDHAEEAEEAAMRAQERAVFEAVIGA